jgi:hypothetical protein
VRCCCQCHLTRSEACVSGLQVRSSKQDQIHNSIVSTLLALMDGLTSRGQVGFAAGLHGSWHQSCRHAIAKQSMDAGCDCDAGRLVHITLTCRPAQSSWMQRSACCGHNLSQTSQQPAVQLHLNLL